MAYLIEYNNNDDSIINRGTIIANASRSSIELVNVSYQDILEAENGINSAKGKLPCHLDAKRLRQRALWRSERP